MKTRIVGGVLFVVVLGLAALVGSGKSSALFAGSASATSAGPSGPPAPLAVRVKRAEKKTLITEVPTNGTLRSNESVEITAEVARRLRKVHVKDGQRVKKGQLLFELDGSDLAARSNEVVVRQRALAIVETRQRKLLDEGLLSKADYDKAKTDLDLAAAQLSVVSADLARTRIAAPFDGRLGILRVSEGAMVGPDKPLITLEDDSRVKIDFSVPERYAAHIKLDAPFSFEVLGGPPISGSVSAIEPKLDERTRSIRLRGVSAVIDQQQASLFAGQYVSVKLTIASNVEVILVPAEVVVPSLGGHTLFVISDGVAKVRQVEIGIRTESEIGIAKGLEPGELVATSNLLKLRPGSKVKVEETP